MLSLTTASAGAAAVVAAGAAVAAAYAADGAGVAGELPSFSVPDPHAVSETVMIDASAMLLHFVQFFTCIPPINMYFVKRLHVDSREKHLAR
ncbi:hypothetical protein D3C84_1179580 [compost metagenome]